ncbi:hypothetical protein [Effusibacillus consociatus]|uniref:Helix-turn-helix domain-containing protein n=1 Tax=Effusibacillus consociatus TaxID=1117041 RepID=A0ABV9Q5J1_9BACL
MEFVTIHELARMSGVSTATIRLDIKAGKIPIAAPGKRGRGNPTRIRISDLESTDRIQYQQLAKQFLQDGSLNVNEREKGKFTVNELALRTGLSPQIVRKDILDGKLKAEGGGRRGSPYYVFMENLADAARIEYRRLTESQRVASDEFREEVKSEISLLKKEIQLLRERLQAFETRVDAGANNVCDRNSGESHIASSPGFARNNIIQVEVASITLPSVFQGYYVSDEKLKLLKLQIQNGGHLDPIQVRQLENGLYLLRRGIAQYHVAQELGLDSLPAHLENSEE